MANHKSAIKRARQNEKRNKRNTGVRSLTRTALKKALDEIQKASSVEEAKKALSAGERALRKAASKGVLPKQRAGRKASRLALMVNRKFSEATRSTAQK